MKTKFIMKKRFIGRIWNIENNKIEVELILCDKKKKEKEFYTSYFRMNEFNKKDIELIKIGATFYWSIGYMVNNKNKSRVLRSIVKMKKTPVWKVNKQEFEFESRKLYLKMRGIR